MTTTTTATRSTRARVGRCEASTVGAGESRGERRGVDSWRAAARAREEARVDEGDAPSRALPTAETARRRRDDERARAIEACAEVRAADFPVPGAERA